MECLLKTNAGHRQKASAKNWVCIMLTVLCGMQIRALCFEEAVCVPCFVLALGGSLPLALRLWFVVCGVMCGVWCVCVVCVWCVCVCGCVCVCVCLCWGGPTKQRCKIDADAWPKSSKKVLEGSKIMKMDRKFMQKLYKMVLGGLGSPLDVPVDKKVPEKRDQVHQGI